MKKNRMACFNMNFASLLLIAALMITAVSCGTNNPEPSKNKAPVISSFKPTKGPIESIVTIKGSKFDSVRSKNTVSFGQTKAVIDSASETKLVVTVPKSLVTGDNYHIMVTVNGKTTSSQNKFKVVTPPNTVGEVPVDGTLEAVTWNIRQYKAQNEPKTNEIVEVLDTLHADFYALEELYNGPKTLHSLTSRMKGYHGIYIRTENEANAIIYNTNAIDSVSSGQIKKYQMLKPWAERLPYYFSFNYHPAKGKPTIRVYAVVIHAKAQTGNDAYPRRLKAAKELHKYLNKDKPDAKIIILGDFNDELDTSIVKGKPSTYKIFVQDSTRYDPITITLSEHHKTSESNPKYQSVIDNIIISNEMVKYYEKNSVQIFIPSKNFIPDYYNTLSDHYPVEAKFDMMR